jgi:hemerythrin-like metal-binding protein
MQFELMEPYRYTLSGHAELDKQQLEFIEMGNKYLKAFNNQNIASVLEPTINYLSDYTKQHFLTQETFMELHAYPAIEKHIAHHNEYIREVAKLFKIMLEFKATKNYDCYERASVNTAMIFVDWFEFHILQADQRLNEFIKYEVKAKRA